MGVGVADKHRAPTSPSPPLSTIISARCASLTARAAPTRRSSLRAARYRARARPTSSRSETARRQRRCSTRCSRATPSFTPPRARATRRESRVLPTSRHELTSQHQRLLRHLYPPSRAERDGPDARRQLFVQYSQRQQPGARGHQRGARRRRAVHWLCGWVSCSSLILVYALGFRSLAASTARPSLPMHPSPSCPLPSRSSRAAVRALARARKRRA